MAAIFEVFELDERTGRWVATDSGSEAAMRESATRKRAAAERFGLPAEFAVAPQGAPPPPREPQAVPATPPAGSPGRPRTRYDDVELPDGARHPLAGVPQDVLDAAREALRQGVIYPLSKTEPYPARDYDADPVLDGELESIADGIVAAIRATGWAARTSGLADLGLTNNLVLARRALQHLASETPLAPSDGLLRHTVGGYAAELAARRAYARRAWLGDRVDLKDRLPQIPTTWRLSKEDPLRFATWNDAWHLLGLADAVRPGEKVMVAVHGDPNIEETEVLVGEVVAERTVRHRGDTETTRYVIATIDKRRG